MNTKALVAALGSTALLANLLLPSIAFGQLTQQGEVTVGCPAYVAGDLTFKRAPADVTFDSVTAGVDVDSVDGSVTSGVNLAGGNDGLDTTDIDGTSIANDHLLRIQDLTSQGVDNCGPEEGWIVTAAVTTAVTDPTSSGFGLENVTTGQSGTYHAIDAADLYLVSSENVDFSNIDTPEVPVLADWDNPNGNPRGNAPVYYARHNTSNVGNPDNLDSAVSTASTTFEDASIYSTDGTSLDAAATILDTNAYCNSGTGVGHYADIYMGVGLALDGAIDALQSAGTYQGTITYTFTPNTCAV